MSIFTKKSLFAALFVILLLVVLVLLAGYAQAGWHSRYLADDYCYDAQFIRNGFWKGQIDSYLRLMPYSSNRYALTLFSGIAWALGGVRIMPLLPGLAILTWLIAIYYAFYQCSRYFALRISKLTLAFISSALVFFTILLASAQYQVLYWRSGMLPYLFPLILSTFLIGRLFFYLRRKKVVIFGFVELGIIAWLGAGFSEIGFAIQFVLWGMILLVFVWKRQKVGGSAVTAILVGCLLGLALLVFNPTNAVRQSPFPAPPPVWEVALTAFRYAIDFSYYYLRGTWLPLMALLIAGFLVGWSEYEQEQFKWRQNLIILILMITGTMILLAANMAPTIWSMSSYPDPRGLFPGNYIINLLLFAVGAWFGAASTVLFRNVPVVNRKSVISALVMLLLTAYLIRFIEPVYALGHEYADRATAWDERNAAIVQALGEGKQSLVVEGIDSIATIFELQPDEKHWVNICAAQYYGLEAIKTSE